VARARRVSVGRIIVGREEGRAMSGSKRVMVNNEKNPIFGESTWCTLSMGYHNQYSTSRYAFLVKQK